MQWPPHRWSFPAAQLSTFPLTPALTPQDLSIDACKPCWTPWSRFCGEGTHTRNDPHTPILKYKLAQWVSSHSPIHHLPLLLALTVNRWIFVFFIFFLYCFRVWYWQGWYVVSYGLGIYLLNILVDFLSPLEGITSSDPIHVHPCTLQPQTHSH